MLATSLTVGTFLFFAFAPLPRAYFPELVLHRPEELVPGLVFAIGVVVWWRKGDWQTDPFDRWLLVGLLINAISEVTYMSLSSKVFDAQFDAAHLLKVVSYGAVGIGLMQNVYASFVAARRSNDHLEELVLVRTTALAAREGQLEALNAELTQQAEELRTSEEELQSHTEQLRQLNEELEEHTSELEGRNRELMTARLGLEDAARELRRTNQYKSEFLANMSHELRTPLNSVLLLSRLLADNKSGDLTSKEVEYAQAIGAAGRQLLALINDVLDLAKVEAGRMDLVLEPTPIPAFLDGFVAEFVHLARDKGLSLRSEVFSDVPDEIHTDPRKLRQILVNLVGNAIKFTDSGGVTLGVETTTLRGLPAVKFRVEDTGIGIPPDARKAIFDAFHQVDGSSTRSHGGTGLGLTISRELATLLGGELELEPQRARGSAFCVVLPLEVGAPGVSAPVPGSVRAPTPVSVAGPFVTPSDHAGAQVAGMSVLIVEDDEIFSSVVAERARARGLEPILARTGADALRLAAYHRPIGVVLDIGLPDMDGWAVLGRLKSNPATASIPVHVVTGRDEADRAAKEGVAFRQKPLTLEQLGLVVESIADGPRAPSVVLIVDDDAVHASSVAALLEAEGIGAQTAGTGEEALALLRSRRFSCAIIDLGLPGMSGSELIELAHADPHIELPGTVLYTGRDLSRTEADALRQHVDTIVIKNEKAPERLIEEVSLFLRTVGPVNPSPPTRGEAPLDDVMAGRRVLIVDDDMRNVFALMAALEDRGLIIEVANDGKEAVDRIRTGAPVDLVLMDIMMPVMNGYEAMEALRAEPRFARLPIIALTAKAMSGDKARCIEAGASDYLPKPVDLDRLLSMLRVWLYERR